MRKLFFSGANILRDRVDLFSCTPIYSEFRKFIYDTIPANLLGFQQHGAQATPIPKSFPLYSPILFMDTQIRSHKLRYSLLDTHLRPAPLRVLLHRAGISESMNSVRRVNKISYQELC